MPLGLCKGNLTGAGAAHRTPFGQHLQLELGRRSALGSGKLAACYLEVMSLAIFSSIGVWEILILLAVLMLLFGSKRLPQMGRSLGRGMREFKDSVGDTGRELKQAISDTPGEVKSGLDPEAAEQQALPAEGRTIEAPVATPVGDSQPTPEAPAGPSQPAS